VEIRAEIEVLARELAAQRKENRGTDMATHERRLALLDCGAKRDRKEARAARMLAELAVLAAERAAMEARIDGLHDGIAGTLDTILGIKRALADACERVTALRTRAAQSRARVLAKQDDVRRREAEIGEVAAATARDCAEFDRQNRVNAEIAADLDQVARLVG